MWSAWNLCEVLHIGCVLSWWCALPLFCLIKWPACAHGGGGSESRFGCAYTGVVHLHNARYGPPGWLLGCLKVDSMSAMAAALRRERARLPYLLLTVIVPAMQTAPMALIWMIGMLKSLSKRKIQLLVMRAQGECCRDGCLIWLFTGGMRP